MYNTNFLTRQMDIIPAEKQGLSIAVVGCGAIGSFTALALAKMGYLNLTCYDMDVVSTENMNCQFYPPAAIGEPKAFALSRMIKSFTGVEITRHNKEIGPDDYLRHDVIISAVDKMSVRANILEVSDSKFLIDPRMGAEYASIEVVDRRNSQHLDNYLKTLYTDDDAVHERCTAKATMYTVMLIAGQIAKAVKDISLGDKYIKTLDWDFKHNVLSSFNNEGVKL